MRDCRTVAAKFAKCWPGLSLISTNAPSNSALVESYYYPGLEIRYQTVSPYRTIYF